jgi:hypothetical protein
MGELSQLLSTAITRPGMIHGCQAISSVSLCETALRKKIELLVRPSVFSNFGGSTRDSNMELWLTLVN